MSTTKEFLNEILDPFMRISRFQSQEESYGAAEKIPSRRYA